MQINVKYLDNLKIEATFDDYKVISDQPIRYKGDGTAPGPFDYFLASSAMCAAYFVKVYCVARNIPTDDIKVTQNNIVDPNDRYKQTIQIEIELPESLSEKDRAGIIASMDRCTVKKVIQNNPTFEIIEKTVLTTEKNLILKDIDLSQKTFIKSKDASLEESIEKMTKILSEMGIKIEIASWRNPIPHVWSVHIRDAEAPLCFTNGKGKIKESTLASALGEFFERMSTNYFYSDFYLGKKEEMKPFAYYPEEKWFKIEDEFPEGLLDEHMLSIYSEEEELTMEHLKDFNIETSDDTLCALPFVRESDKETIYVPTNILANLYVSNGMSAGNTLMEARVQALSEIIERAIKKKIIKEEITLPDIPREELEKYPTILEGIKELEAKGYPIYIKDASLGGIYPVVNITLINPRNGGVFASFGAHPKFEVALERTLTELMQGRSFEGLNDTLKPTFNSFAVSESNNLVDHFIDSIGVVSWRFFKESSDYSYSPWNIEGNTEEEYKKLVALLTNEGHELYTFDSKSLGVHTTRIIIPGFSEIYEPTDLIWDNNNKGLSFREKILNLHSLAKKDLKILSRELNESELDDYMLVSELIGIAFEEVSPWGKLTLLELKIHIALKLQNKDEALEHLETYAQFNDNIESRKKFFEALKIILEIEVNPEEEFMNYEKALKLMYGNDLIDIAKKASDADISFYGLVEIGENFEGIKKHQDLLAHYQKIREKRFSVI